MTKRTFVLFLCLFQSLAFPLFAKQQATLCKIDIGTAAFSPFFIEEGKSAADVIILDDTIDPNRTVIKEDVCKWRENLSKMLRHRHSTYRFTLFESVVFSDFKFVYNPKLVLHNALTVIFASESPILPGYYSFLHRLCPF